MEEAAAAAGGGRSVGRGRIWAWWLVGVVDGSQLTETAATDCSSKMTGLPFSVAAPSTWSSSSSLYTFIVLSSSLFSSFLYLLACATQLPK